VFRALADPTRRQILYDLRNGELSAGAIASHFPISGPSVSRHLAVLKSAGLITERKQANRVMYSAVGERLAGSVGAFLSGVCPDKAERNRDKKKAKSGDKGATKRKRKAQAHEPRPPNPEPTERAAQANGGGGGPAGAVYERAEVPESSEGVGSIWPVRAPQRQGVRDGHSTPRT
jgi:DNA-binding transcriptional ArsR family regulator